MTEEEMKAARAKLFAALKTDNAGVLPAAPLVATKRWCVDVKADGVDKLRGALDLDGYTAEERDAAIEATRADGEDGVVIGMRYSDKTEDSYADTIDPNGWKLDEYKRNPVVLFAHDQSAPSIGKDVGIRVVKDTALEGVVRFTPAGLYEFGDMIGRMVKGGFLNASSVGFAPIKYIINEERSGPWGFPGIDYLEQKLKENSIVPVPANPNALAEGRALKAAGINTRPLIEWAEKQLDGEGALVLPRHVLESIARTGVPARITVTAKGDDVATAELSADVAMAAEDTPAPEASTETKAGTECKCPECGHIGPASTFEKPADEPEPTEGDMKAAEALPMKALMAALAKKGVAVQNGAQAAKRGKDVDSESGAGQDVARSIAEKAAKAAAAEVKKQLMQRTGRLP
jgi:phage head maturation protease